MILATNVLVTIGVGITLINNSGVILVGRFIFGMAAGTFTVICPKFVSELSPPEYKGPFGAVSQFMCTVGIFLVNLLCVSIPDYSKLVNEDQNTFLFT